MPPLVSVITSTYNRGNILPYTIESVLWQTFADWELIVVGDACTDNTQEVVEEYAARDERVRFFNLEKNIGEQSGPHNFACTQVRGRYIAYLNHDDLWRKDHLEIAVQAIEEAGADFAHTMISMVRPEGEPNPVHGLPWNNKKPPTSVPCSCWLFRRELVQDVGPWSFYRDCWNIPSQDWVYRVWKAGKTIVSVPSLTVFCLTSAVRPNSYKDRHSKDNQDTFHRLCHDPDFIRKLLEEHGATTEQELVDTYPREFPPPQKDPLRTYPRRLLRWWFYRQVRGAAALLGCEPVAWERKISQRWRRGAYVDELRQIRGLPKLK